MPNVLLLLPFCVPYMITKLRNFQACAQFLNSFSMKKCNIMEIYSIFCLQVFRKEQPWCILLLVLKITLKLTVNKWQSKAYIQHCSRVSNFYLQIKDRPGAQARVSSQVYKPSFSYTISILFSYLTVCQIYFYSVHEVKAYKSTEDSNEILLNGWNKKQRLHIL